jgi:predicted deacylase
MSKLAELCAPRDGSPNSGKYSIGTITAEPGDRVRGGVPIATGANGGLIEIPVEVVHGEHAGPVIAVGAGVHGDEYDSMQAVRLMLAELDPATLHGTFVGMPCVNTHAFAAASRVSGLDHQNFNRIFPGDSEGTVSQRMAATFVTDVVPNADVFLDLHTGGQYGEITPLAVVQRGHEDIARELGMASGNPILWKGGAWGGTARSAFLAEGKPAVTLEAGGGTFRADVAEHHLGSIRNVLKHLRMIDGQSVLRESYSAVNATFARASSGGFYLGLAEPGEKCKEGDEIALIIDHFGEVRERVLAPVDGVVLWVRRLRTVNPGEETVIFGPIEETVTP